MKRTITSVVLSMSLVLLSGWAAAALRPAVGTGSGADAVARAPAAEIARTTNHEITLHGRAIHYQRPLAR
jgi:hypothetical protein